MRFAFILLTPILAIAGEFSTALSDANSYSISGITTDAAGNTYIVGNRALQGVPTAIAILGAFSAVASPYFAYNTDVFVTKLDPNGKLLFTDTFAGKGSDTGNAIAVDPSGNIYIAGITSSPDFPISKAIQTQPNPNGGTGFIVKLSSDGSTILYSTYFGGVLGITSISSIATDATGNLFLTGATTAADFPHTAGMPSGATGAIISAISAAGDKVLFSGVIIGGPIPVAGAYNLGTGGLSVAVDATGNAYFAGNTSAANLPTTPGVIQPTGSFTGFLAKVNANTTSLGYLTYLPSHPYAMAVDPAGNAYIAGFSPQGINGPYLISVTKINPSATAVVWTNNLQNAANGIQSIAVDANGNVWVTGQTSSAQFPNANGWTTGPEFLVGLNSSGTKITYSALFPYGTIAESVAVDPSGLVHVAGLFGFVSAIAPSAAPSMKIFGFQNAAGGQVTARLSPSEVISIYGPGIGPSTAATAPVTGGFYPTTFAGVQVTINGMNMPLLYVSATQINAVVPMEIAPGTAATIRVINGTTASPGYPVWILPGAAQPFLPVLNQDGSLNSQTNPAKGGSIVTFYATGFQSSFAPLADGQVATAAVDICHNVCQAFSTVSSATPLTATVVYGGAAPGIVAGVTQFNVRINPLPPSTGLNQFNFNVTGPASFNESVWVMP